MTNLGAPKSKTKHWDAIGNPILGYFDMKEYYRLDMGSRWVLTKWLPHQYRCIPSVTIRFDVGQKDSWYITRVYPGGERSIYRMVGTYALEWARKVYAGKSSQWRAEKNGTWITLFKRGFLIPMADKDYYRGW